MTSISQSNYKHTTKYLRWVMLSIIRNKNLALLYVTFFLQLKVLVFYHYLDRSIIIQIHLSFPETTILTTTTTITITTLPGDIQFCLAAG